MAEAYRQLGYHTHHGLDDVLNNPWESIEKAAEATWPVGLGQRAGHARIDWGMLCQPFDVVTDLYTPFTAELIKAYPEAKVVIVQRDFDSWWASFDTHMVRVLFQPLAPLMSFIIWHLSRNRGGYTMRKVLCGMFHAKGRREIERNARVTYDKYYETIRALVPPERRLEYKIGSGWEPLCNFLGKKVPPGDFPRVNDTAQFEREARTRNMKMIIDVLLVCLPWILGLAIFVVGGMGHTALWQLPVMAATIVMSKSLGFIRSSFILKVDPGESWAFRHHDRRELKRVKFV